VLRGAPMHAADIRAGGALIVAALAARGHSTITGVQYVRRGYESFAERLSTLGARIRLGAAPVAISGTGTYGD
jgi:UDP-N-acetylglucosamine 1-carboxyvinyltransferase